MLSRFLRRDFAEAILFFAFFLALAVGTSLDVASGFTPSLLSLAAAEIVGPSTSAPGDDMLEPSIDTNSVVVRGLCVEGPAYAGAGLRGGGRRSLISALPAPARISRVE